MNRPLACVAILFTVSACSGLKSAKVQSLQPTDKHLACADIKLELNEAKFFKRKAVENRGLSFRNVLMPHTYPSTYMSATDAISSADERIDYLQNIYNIRECEAKAEMRMTNAPTHDAVPAVPVAAAPAPLPHPPMMPPQMYSMAPSPAYGLDYRPMPGYYAPPAYMPQAYAMPQAYYGPAVPHPAPRAQEY